MRGFFIVFMCLSIWLFTSTSRSYAETQAEMTDEACLVLRNSNVEMKNVLKMIINHHQDNKRFIAALRKSQRVWSVFRDAELNTVYPESPDRYGSSYGMCRCTVLNELTRERIEKLNKWLTEGTEGDVCAGSMK